MYQGSLAIAGECMCTRPFSMHDEPEFLELVKILSEADTSYCHLEMNLHKKDEGYSGRPFASSALQADPIIAQELKWLGIDLVSCAHNHVLDWGIPSILGTIESLDQAGIIHAGTGNNLEEAREPAYFESSAGRVAIVSLSSGHHPYDSAGAVKAPAKGRPGVNPLRVRQKYVVSSDDLEKIKSIWSKLGLNLRRPFTEPAEEGDNFFVLGDIASGAASSIIFNIGDKPEVVSILNKWDVEGNLRAIRDAKRQADLVIVAHHAHIFEGKGMSTMISFVPPFAKECLDNGADIYVGHGSHRLLGLELYKGKPIFYGPGNFFAQSNLMTRFPADAYDGHGFNLDNLNKLTSADIQDSRENHMAHWSTQPGGVMATLNIDDGKFKSIKLFPYSLGYDFEKGSGTGSVRETAGHMDGRPMLTYGENARRIIEHLRKESAAFNTKIDFQNDVGTVTIDQTGPC